MNTALLIVGLAAMLLLSKAAMFLRRRPDDVWGELPVRGLAVPAEVVSVHGSVEDRDWQLHYRFTLRDQTYDGRQTVPRAVAEALGELGHANVRYLPDRPEIHRLVMPK